MKTNKQFISSLRILVLFISTAIIYTGCSKEEDNKAPQDNTAVVKQNVKVINPDDATLISNSDELLEGIYKFEFNTAPDNFTVGDIIVGKEGYGFLRRVNSVSTKDNTVIFETEQASLTDVFSQANYSFGADDFQGTTTVKSTGEGVKMLKSSTPSSFEYDFSNTILYEDEDLIIKIETGRVSNTSSYNTSTGIDGLDVNTEMVTTNVFDIQCVIKITGSKIISIADINKVLADVEHIIVFEVMGVPIVFVIDTKCTLQYMADFSGEINATVDLSQRYTSRYGLIYENGQWTTVNETTPTFPSDPINLTGTKASVDQKLTIIPYVSFKFYGIAGFNFTPTLWGSFDFNLGYPANWDAMIKAGVNINIGAEFSLLGINESIDKDIYTDEWELWSAPYLLTKISGDDQVGAINTQLTQPIKVLATDSWNNPLPGVLVHYNVIQGDGSVSNCIAITDTAGYAMTDWTLGPISGAQTTTAQIKKADGSDISGSPQTFNATAY